LLNINCTKQQSQHLHETHQTKTQQTTYPQNFTNHVERSARKPEHNQSRGFGLKDTSQPLQPQKPGAQLEEDDEFEDFPVEGTLAPSQANNCAGS
jgi:deoxyribodipyrimidine photolyase